MRVDTPLDQQVLEQRMELSVVDDFAWVKAYAAGATTGQLICQYGAPYATPRMAISKVDQAVPDCSWALRLSFCSRRVR